MKYIFRKFLFQRSVAVSWKKFGDFKKIFHSAGLLNRKCKYKNPESAISEIRLFGFSDGEKQIVACFRSKEAANNFLALFKELNAPVGHVNREVFPKVI